MASFDQKLSSKMFDMGYIRDLTLYFVSIPFVFHRCAAIPKTEIFQGDTEFNFSFVCFFLLWLF